MKNPAEYDKKEENTYDKMHSYEIETTGLIRSNSHGEETK
jgi:hypothetical protein